MNPENTPQQIDELGEFKPVITAQQLAKLKAFPLFRELTPKQQDFVIAYIGSQYDLREAVLSCYECRNEKSAAQVGRMLLRNWKIRKVLSYYGDYSLDGAAMSRAEALQLIAGKLRDPKTDANAFQRLMTTMIEMSGWEQPKRKPTVEEKTAAPEPDMNQIILELEHKRKQNEASKNEKDQGRKD